MKTKLLDCTIRDGGYINNWRFSDQFVEDLTNTLDNVGYDYIELGYCYDNNKYCDMFGGKWRNVDSNSIDVKSNNIKFALMCDNKEFKKTLFHKHNKNIDLIRLAFHKNDLNSVFVNALYLQKLGYKISLNAMGTINYTDEELKFLCENYVKYSFEYLYIADTYGGMYPSDIKNIQDKIYKYTNNNVKLGFHAHNNIQNAINNVFYCINNNFDIVDTTVMGLGRGAGNAQTELLLCKLNKEYGNYDPYSTIIFINKHMYNHTLNNKNYLPYLISGYFNCHPSYISKIIENNITDYSEMWTILEKICLLPESNSFNNNILETIICDKNHDL
jgi:4-hydroxy 2-oxovalerate aldolase